MISMRPLLPPMLPSSPQKSAAANKSKPTTKSPPPKGETPNGVQPTATSRSARTRERILSVSLALFNDSGEANITTGHIADELNISPGNLYYHFRNKEEIIHYLFADFEKLIDVAPKDLDNVAASMEDMWLYLHLMFEGIWEYRFLYRNLDDLMSRDAKLRSHFNIIVAHKRSAVIALCESLVHAKAMRASEMEIAALTENVLVVATYWLNFQHLSLRPQSKPHAKEEAQSYLSRGVYQVMCLLAPFLHGEARAHLDELKSHYLT
jgi:AcrR family transcriptional regulator